VGIIPVAETLADMLHRCRKKPLHLTFPRRL
jgi:hypothetical protein